MQEGPSCFFARAFGALANRLRAPARRIVLAPENSPPEIDPVFHCWLPCDRKSHTLRYHQTNGLYDLRIQSNALVRDLRRKGEPKNHKPRTTCVKPANVASPSR